MLLSLRRARERGRAGEEVAFHRLKLADQSGSAVSWLHTVGAARVTAGVSRGFAPPGNGGQAVPYIFRSRDQGLFAGALTGSFADSGGACCDFSQIARISSDRVMGSKGLQITSRAPSLL
jgi:hypothetical protein